MVGRKPKVSRERAASIAARFIESRNLNGWRFEIAEVKRAPVDPENWTIVVARFSPEGNEVDGPEILVVDGQNGHLETLEAHVERKLS